MSLVGLLPLFKLAGVFGLVILFIRLSSYIGLALGLGATALGLAFSMGPKEILQAFGAGLVERRSLMLALIVTLILILSASLERLGQMEDLLRRFKAWVGGKRWGLVAFPALIGLLPMPGGAVFSAPMLDSFDLRKQLIPSLKSFLNYWYRHIWEYWWPLYPALLLVCAIMDLHLWRYILFALPMTGVAILGGLPQLMRVPRTLHTSLTEKVWDRTVTGWASLSPLLLAILPGIAFGVFLRFFGASPGWDRFPKESGLVAGLVAAVGWAWWERGVRLHQVRKILLDRKLPRMLSAIAGVFAFKAVMEQSGAAPEVGAVLIQLKIPLLWVVVLLPMILGAVSGLPLVFVGVTFPVLLTLIQAMGATNMKLPLALLAFVAGVTGVMMSPVHLCLILSNEYFEASWPRVYSRLWFPALILLAGGLAYSWILRGLI